MDMEPLMPFQPRLNLGMFVRRVIVDDQMKLLAFGGGLINQTQELEPLLMAMLGHAIGNHFTVENVERGKQCSSAVALVIMGHGAGSSFFQGQSGLGSI